MGADGLPAALLWVTCPPDGTHPGFCCGPRGWRAGWALHARPCGSVPVTSPSRPRRWLVWTGEFRDPRACFPGQMHPQR